MHFSNVEGYAKLFCVLVSEIFVNEYFTSFEIDSIYLLLLNVSLMYILLRNIKHHVTRRTLHYTDDVPELLTHFWKVFAKSYLYLQLYICSWQTINPTKCYLQWMLYSMHLLYCALLYINCIISVMYKKHRCYPQTKKAFPLENNPILDANSLNHQHFSWLKITSSPQHQCSKAIEIKLNIS